MFKAGTAIAIVNGYTTLASLKERIDATDTGNDTVYEAVIEAASRQIDGTCGRSFYQVTEARYFTGDCGHVLDVDDLVSVSALATDGDGDRTYETTWAVTDYDLEPYNAASRGFPYTQIHIAPNGNQSFTRVRRGVRVTGVWGWPAIPDAVNEACLLLAARLAKRPSTPFAIDLMSGDMGSSARIPSVDPDVKVLLAPYRKFYVGGV